MGERDRIRVQHMLDAANKVISATQNRQRTEDLPAIVPQLEALLETLNP